jgi:hypothetical protein
MFDINHFSNYYSVDELMEELKKNNIELEELLKLDIKDIFDISIKKGILDLVEYLYVWYDVEYELCELLNITNININGDISESNSTTVLYDSGAKSGLKLEYFNKESYNVQKSIQKLTSLRKYSSMTTNNKKFYYKFKPKYRETYWINYGL